MYILANAPAIVIEIVPTITPNKACFLSFFMWYIKAAGNTKDAPIIKLANSPTPPVLVLIIKCRSTLIS